MFVIFDIALFLAILALILYILVVTGILAFQGSGALIQLFLVIAIVLFIIWIVIRLFGCFRLHRNSNGNNNVVVV
jgi:hypothetical protein